METKLLAVLALAFIGMQTALACDGPKSLSDQYIDVRFESDSSEIPVTELARLSYGRVICAPDFRLLTSSGLSDFRSRLRKTRGNWHTDARKTS